MRTTNITITCDLCGEPMSESEPHGYKIGYVLAKLEFVPVYEDGTHYPVKIARDACDKCSSKLFEFLQKENMLKHAQGK